MKCTIKKTNIKKHLETLLQFTYKDHGLQCFLLEAVSDILVIRATDLSSAARTALNDNPKLMDEK